MKSVQLIQPSRSPGYGENSRSACYPPLGLVSIATHLGKSIPSVRVEILDGELLSTTEIIDKLEPNAIVGIETKTPNYRSAIKIAEAAKERGSIVVLGGVYASAIPSRILKLREGIVDHVVVGYGEVPMRQIVEGPVTEQLIRNPMPIFNELPPLDRSFVDMETYIDNFTKEHPSWEARGTNIFTHMGCKYKCVFCSRMKPGKGISFRDPEKVWEEVRSVVDEFEVDYIVDFSDTITQSPPYLARLADAKPHDLDPRLHVFSTADGINESTTRDFQRMNVAHVFIGVETGDSELAKRTLKGREYKPETALRAIESLSKVGIRVTPSFVLGLPGETSETLRKTYDFAVSLQDVADFEEVFACELIPFPGAPAFPQLEERVLSEGNSWDTDLFDPEELKEEWRLRFCPGVSREELRICVNDILELGKYTITIRGHGV